MDMYFEDQKCKILKYIDDRGEELARLLYKFKVSIFVLVSIVASVMITVLHCKQSYTMAHICATCFCLNISITGRVRRGSRAAAGPRGGDREAADRP